MCFGADDCTIVAIFDIAIKLIKLVFYLLLTSYVLTVKYLFKIIHTESMV